jgi:hypothetical protein
MRNEIHFARHRVAIWRKPITHRLELPSIETTQLRKSIHAPTARFSHPLRPRCAARARNAQLFPAKPAWPSAGGQNFFRGELFVSIARCASRDQRNAWVFKF